MGKCRRAKRSLVNGNKNGRTYGQQEIIAPEYEPPYIGPITRSAAKKIEKLKNFQVVEVYKCMPLIGGEENVPNWTPHVASFRVELTK